MKEAKKLIVLKCTPSVSSQSSAAASNRSSSHSLSLAAAPTRTKTQTALQSFFNKCEYSLSSEEFPSNEVTALTIQQEIATYTSSTKESADFEQYWKKHHRQLPRLAGLARRFCIMTATSVASECAFSIAGYVQRKQRSSLSPAALRYSMVLRESDLIQNMATELEDIS